MCVSMADATAWVQAALKNDAHRAGEVITAVREWEHGWLFVCLQPGQEGNTNSPFIVDRRDGMVYTGSSVIGSARAVEIIMAGPESITASRRVFRVGVVIIPCRQTEPSIAPDQGDGC